MFVPLCEAWPLPVSGCVDIPGTAPVTGTAVQAASEYLWWLSGCQYGTCTTTLRPCAQACAPAWAPPSWGGWWRGGWPWVPAPGATLWANAVCGACGAGGCSCNNAATLTIPGPVQAVTQVLIDGAVLPASGYLLYNGDTLVRTDGEAWPLCQDWGQPVTGVGAWAYTATIGHPVPALGSLALAEVAHEFATACTGGECRHPRYMTAKTRQGVTQEFPSVADLAKVGLTGWPATDDFLRAVNPKGQRWTAGIWNPDEVLDAPRRHWG